MKKSTQQTKKEKTINKSSVTKSTIASKKKLLNKNEENNLEMINPPVTFPVFETPNDGETITVRRRNIYSRRSLYEYRTTFEGSEHGNVTGAIVKEINGEWSLYCLFEDVGLWGRWDGEDPDEYRKQWKKWEENPEPSKQPLPLRGDYIERQGPAYQRYFERPVDGERIKVFTGKWMGWSKECIYKDLTIDGNRGVIFNTRIITYGNGVRETTGESFCNFEDVWQWESLDNPSDGTMNGMGWGDDTKIKFREGLNEVKIDFAMSQDRFHSPENNERIHAKLLNVWAHGTYIKRGDILQLDHGSLPFRLVTDYKRDTTGANYSGPSHNLDGPRTWEELPTDSGEMRYLRETLEWAAGDEASEKAEKEIKQLHDELTKVEMAMKTAHDIEHAILILRDVKKHGEWTNPKTGEVNNWYAQKFPMHSSFIARIDSMIEERTKAVALRYELQPISILNNPVTTGEDNSSSHAPYNFTVKELAAIAGMTPSGVRKELNTENPKIKGVRVHFERNNDRKHARYSIADSSFERIKRKVVPKSD